MFEGTIIKSIFLSVIAGTCVAFLVMGASYVVFPPKKIGTANVTQLVDEFVKPETQKHLTQNILKQETKEFGGRLERALKEVAEKNHVVLLPSEAALAGANDYTQEVRTLLNEKGRR